jgi:ankyrin repeat protein
MSEVPALAWLGMVYAGDITGTMRRPRPDLAASLLAAHPGLGTDSAYLACAAGELDTLRAETARDPEWVHCAGGPLGLPPLVAVTHSCLVQLQAFRESLYASARFLLEAGADPNQATGNRWPPASVVTPNAAEPLSALYGAAGSNRDPVMTAILLDGGADPNDGESLYHSLENPACTRLLLAHGAAVAGNNVLYRALDLPDASLLEVLLAHGGDANEPARDTPISDWGSPLLWAIRRRRSLKHVMVLLDSGADLACATPEGIGAYRLALLFGLPEIASLLESRGAGGEVLEAERFVAACARADAAEARQLLDASPGLVAGLSPFQQRLLPELAANGASEAVMLMVSLGWPVAMRGGDWDASALNHAVFRGDAALTRFLLEQGAAWTERQGFGDDVCGTLSWASCNLPEADGDWARCARVLREHGLPAARAIGDDPETVILAGVQRRFSDSVRAALLA